GLNYYPGTPSFRPFLGDPGPPLEPSHLAGAMGIARLSAWLAAATGIVLSLTAIAALSHLTGR
ncbi:MAG TPA: hypothetical protein GX513_08940, partial [Firmicutes bacterium]|nr:hypothetical protein [Bacillota bacterium]